MGLSHTHRFNKLMSELLHINISQPFRVLRLTAALEENAQAVDSSFGGECSSFRFV